MFSHREFPKTRLRRSRQADWSRNIVSENSLSMNDFIYPIFISESKSNEDIISMPGVQRISLNNLLKTCEKICEANINVVALFPQIHSDKKDDVGTEALNQNNIICKAITLIKKHFIRCF